MHPVTKDQFYARMNPLNVHPRIINSRYPYTTDWHLQGQGQPIVGRSVGRVDGGWDYFLPDSQVAA